MTLLALACFSPLTVMSLFPRRSAFEQDVEHGNTDGLGDCQSKQALHNRSSLHLVSFFSRLQFPTTLLSPFSIPPACSALTILSFSLVHPSVPFDSRTPLSVPCCLSGPLVNRVLCPVGQRLDAFLQTVRTTPHKHSDG